ncbi:kelch-like protein 9/13 [Microdochium nivale]|nr:kelch-like protein 9/13 [Microdochium nivale]
MGKREAETDEVAKYTRHGGTVSIAEYHDMVTIMVPSGKQFHVYAQLLVEFSDYFLKALNSTYTEANTLSFSLQEHANDVTMSIVVDLIYASAFSNAKMETFFKGARLDLLKERTQAWKTRGNRTLGDSSSLEDPSVEWYIMLGETWLLADYLQMQAVKETIMEYLIREDVANAGCDALEDLGGPEHLVAIKWPPQSHIWKYHCFALARHWSLHHDQTLEDLPLLEELDKETLIQVTRDMMGMRTGGKKTLINRVRAKVMDQVVQRLKNTPASRKMRKCSSSSRRHPGKREMA